MRKIERDCLFCVDEEEYVSDKDSVFDSFLNSVCNVIYIEDKSGQLQGIITIGDLIRAGSVDNVCINRDYRSVRSNELSRARELLDSGTGIKNVPIVDPESGILAGEYRDDGGELSLEYHIPFKNKEFWRYQLSGLNSIAMIEIDGFEQINESWVSIRKGLSDICPIVDCIDRRKMNSVIDKYDLIIFPNDDSLRSAKAYHKIKGNNTIDRRKCIVFRDIRIRSNKYNDDTEKLFVQELINSLVKQGIQVILLNNSCADNPYHAGLMTAVSEKYSQINKPLSPTLYEEWYDDFFGEDGISEKSHQIAEQKYFQCIDDGLIKLTDTESDYYNVKNGCRVTVDQPCECERNIHFFGGCFIVGWMSEDRCTIESYLQRKMNDNFLPAKIVNNGFWGVSRADRSN